MCDRGNSWIEVLLLIALALAIAGAAAVIYAAVR